MKKQNIMFQEFEEKRHELLSLMIALTERRLKTAGSKEFLVGKIMAALVVTVQAALDAFAKTTNLKK